MKTCLTFFVSLLIVFQSFASDWTGIRSDNPVPGQKQLVSSGTDYSIVLFSTGGFFTNQVSTPQGPAVIISMDGASQLLQKGAPDLPKMTASVIAR